MKAIVISSFGDEDVLRCQDVPVPEPNEGEVRVRVMAAGVNPVETYIRAGQYGQLPTLPYTPGNDAAGVVDKVGQGVRGLAAGDRVFVSAVLAKRNTGSYAEFMVCDADAVRSLPDRASFAEGAGLGTPGLAATYALFPRGKTRPGETVLVHGASGGVGILAVQLARRAGAIVFGTAGDDRGQKLVREVGAHRVFNHNHEGYIREIADASAGGGPDVVVEMVANVNLAKDLSVMARHGRVVIVGNHGSLDFNPRDLMAKDGSILAVLISLMPHRDYAAGMCLLSAALESGMKVVVGQEVPLAEASRAHALVAQGKGQGKVVLVMDA